MPQAKVEKAHFTFSKGLVTERSPLNFEDGAALDMADFELLVDGSAKRRRGCRLEVGGSQLELSSTPGADAAFNYTLWRNAGGDPARTFVVVQIGTSLYLFNEDTTLSDELNVVLDLGAYTSTSVGDLELHPFTFAVGRSHLFVSSPFLQPLYIAYDTDLDTFTVNLVALRIRDFEGVDDGTPNTTQPSILTDDHRYNLLNRGWVPARIEQYFTDKSRYPSKAMVPWMGYRRQTVAGFAEDDGTKQWSSDKMEAEIFGDSSAAQGRLYIDPFDTQSGLNVDGEPNEIQSWSKTGTGQFWEVTINTVDPHGFVVGDSFVITGNRFTYNYDFGPVEFTNVEGTLDGQYTVLASPDADTFTFTKDWFGSPVIFWDSFAEQNLALGFIGAEPSARSGGYVTDARPTAVAFYAGRPFWAGASHPALADIVFFGQVAEGPSNYDRCYQYNDPTAEHFNALLPTDGGTIKVPGLAGVKAMVVFGAALLVFSSNGVWSISGGSEAGFAANGYIVRKVSDVEAWSAPGITVTDAGVVFTSPRGLYAISQDANSGFLVATSLTEQTIQTLWNAIPDAKQERVQCAYDDARKRVYWLYTNDEALGAFQYDRALVLDLRLNGYYPLRFPTSGEDFVTGVAALESGDNSQTNKKMKFFVLRNTRTDLDVCDLAHDDFVDFDETEQIPFLTTAYDNLEDWQRHKQAPHVFVYMRKTETGYTEVGGDLVPINPSGLLMQGRWDWADHSNSGKFGTSRQVYRHSRLYQPSGPSDGFDDGQPVVVTRNKVRGRGRALHLHFTGEQAKDAHILGFLVKYLAEREA